MHGRALVVTVALLAAAAYAVPTSAQRLVRVVVSESLQRDNHFETTLLRIALANAPRDRTPARYALHTVTADVSQSRLESMLEAGQDIDVMWFMTSADRESRLRAVRVPLLRGLLGTRVMLIRNDDQPRFDAIRSLDDVRSFTAGQGKDWPDSRILEAAGISVIGSPHYRTLFDMLRARRFDMFPRSVAEAAAELLEHDDLAIEKRLLLVYASPLYYFTRADDETLAKHMHARLMEAVDDGRFQALLDRTPRYRQARALLAAGERLIVRIPNPLLPPQTPLHDRRLWHWQHGDGWLKPASLTTAH